MSNVLSVLEKLSQELCRACSVSTTKETTHSMSALRAQSLLLRSLLSTATTLVIHAANFFHPFIERTLCGVVVVHAIAVQQLSSGKAALLPDCELLHQDIDRLLKAVSAKIPPRLSIPTLLKTTPRIFAEGSAMGAGRDVLFACARRYVEMLGELFRSLDRATVAANMKPLSALCLLLLDYRRVYGDQSMEGDAVDEAAASAMVEFCLKLTESELKHLLLRVMEWRDAAVDDDDEEGEGEGREGGGGGSRREDWRKYSRAVSFYTLVSHLSGTLKVIFLPSMALVWTHAAGNLAALEKAVAKTETEAKAVDQMEGGVGEGEKGLKKSKKGKKRKAKEMDSATSSWDPEASRNLVELRTLCGKVASSVLHCCKSDTEGFVNEVLHRLS
jgi:hypothetical protein